MRILVVGSLLGKVDLVNEYISNTKADVVLCTGDMGIFYKDTKTLPKPFDDNEFYHYLEGSKSFRKPLYTVKGPHDNISLCRRLLSKEITIYNFNLISDGSTVLLNNNTKDSIPIDNIIVGGIGGSYSPTNYIAPIEDQKQRHFNIDNVNNLKKNKLHILLMYDVIDNHSDKKIEYSDETFHLIEKTMPFYYLVGKYNWFVSSKIADTNFVTMPNAKNGYLIIDTNKDWNARGVKLDMNIGGINDTINT